MEEIFSERGELAMNVLIIGGTRNMGHFLALALYEAGHAVTVLNRGITRDDLPADIQRLQADRTIRVQLEQALAGRRFDAVVDFVLYGESDAQVIVDLLHGRVAHYVFISTGQVYLIRDGAKRPFTEAEYDGPLIDEPPLNTYDHEEWSYGMQKRRVEAVLEQACRERDFPITSLRLPMVNGERDPFNRLYGYILRLKDGGPLLVPETPDHVLRHVYSGDVVRAVMKILEKQTGIGEAYNISQDETLSLHDFLTMLGGLMSIAPRIIRVERSLLEANGFLPDCSPFSDLWMSELDNQRSRTDLSMTYTPLKDYLKMLVDHYEADPPRQPTSYRRRHAERIFAEHHATE
jgi:nucleoside-diphosphate-sugar epimerase